VDYRIRWRQQRRARQRKRVLIVPAAFVLALALYWLLGRVGGGGGVHWVHQTSADAAPHLAATPLLVFVVLADGHVEALRASDGGPVSDAPFFSVPEAFNATPTVTSQALYFGSDLGVLRALDARSGQLLWERDLGAAIRGQPLWHGDRLYVGTDGGRVYCFLPGGTKVWSVGLRDAISGRPAAVGKLLIVATTRGAVHGLSLQDGTIVWRQELRTAVFSPVTAAEPFVLLGGDAGRLELLDAAAGRPVRSYHSRGLVRGAAAVSDEIIAFGSTDRWLRVISRDGKEPLWAHYLPGPVTAGPTVAEGLLYVACPRRLVALSAATGRVVRSWKGEQFAGDLVVTPDMVYVGTSTGAVHALAAP
jgi:outer membrane protein assembly factor BamB